ncbi:hypothetical protein IFR05_011456 [Cadophora sp. M221]|nr:hypothetical protein IFR05_011456 [Cadophora sp. M221]
MVPNRPTRGPRNTHGQGNRADNDNGATNRISRVRLDPNARRKVHNLFLSGPGMSGDLQAEEDIFLAHRGSSDVIKQSWSTHMPIKTATHFASEHNFGGKFKRLQFRTERGAKAAYKLLMVPGNCSGIVPASGKQICVTQCISEFHALKGIDRCLCSPEKLEAEVGDLAGEFSGLNVEQQDITMQGEIEALISKPELDINALAGELQNWETTPRDNGDSEML